MSCLDLFGPDDHKKDFYVFDVCGVFDFFEQHPEGIMPSKTRSLSEATFIARVELVHLLQHEGDANPDSADFGLAKSMVAMLHQQVLGLDTHSFEVQLQLQHTEHYAKLESWSTITAPEIPQLAEHIAPLIHNDETNELVKRFDYLMVKLQLAVFRSERSQAIYLEKLQAMASELLRKADTVPTIAQRRETLIQVIQPEFWAEASIPSIEKVRIELRELSKLVDISSGKGIFYTNFQDEITFPIAAEPFIGSYGSFESLYAKLKKIIVDNAHHLTIHRLYTNQPITTHELDELDRMLFAESGAESHEAFKKLLGDKPLGAFIRSILGLDSNAARAAFSSFLSNGPLTSVQIEFINQLIELLTTNGTVNPEMLFEQPFTKFDASGVGGVFPLNAEKVFEIIEETNQRAMAG